MNHDLQIVSADSAVSLLFQLFIIDVFFPGWLPLK